MASRKVGFLHNGTKASFQRHYAAFVTSLYDFIGESPVRIVERWAGDDSSKTLEQHGRDLVSDGVAVLVAAGGPPTALAAQKVAGGKTPVVFISPTDPVGLGLVQSLDAPGGNITGVAGLTSELDVTRLQLLHEVLGFKPARIAVLNNASRPYLQKQYDALESAVAGTNITLVRTDVSGLDAIAAAFNSFKAGTKIDGVLITADSMFNDLRNSVVELAKDAPAIYQWREFAEAGGLMSFGPDILDAYAEAGEFTSRILDGDSPADLPVALPGRLKLVLNYRVAHAMKLAIPASILSRATLVRSRLHPHGAASAN